MNEKKDLSAILDEIIANGDEIIKSGKSILTCAEVVIKALKEMKALCTTTTEPALSEKPKPASLPDKETTAMEYTFADVRGIMAGLAGKGKKAEARALLQKYGVSRLSDLDEKDYASIAEEAKVIANG